MIRRRNWSEVDEAAKAIAHGCAKGVYQRNVIDGIESLSGSTLRGKARDSYGGAYARSRRNLLARMRAEGLVVGERKAAKGARILVVRAEACR